MPFSTLNYLEMGLHLSLLNISLYFCTPFQMRPSEENEFVRWKVEISGVSIAEVF